VPSDANAIPLNIEFDLEFIDDFLDPVEGYVATVHDVEEVETPVIYTDGDMDGVITISTSPGWMNSGTDIVIECSRVGYSDHVLSITLGSFMALTTTTVCTTIVVPSEGVYAILKGWVDVEDEVPGPVVYDNTPEGGCHLYQGQCVVKFAWDGDIYFSECKDAYGDDKCYQFSTYYEFKLYKHNGNQFVYTNEKWHTTRDYQVDENNPRDYADPWWSRTFYLNDVGFYKFTCLVYVVSSYGDTVGYYPNSFTCDYYASHECPFTVSV
jgi:hypothetical protein